jgi:fructuronate reductase
MFLPLPKTPLLKIAVFLLGVVSEITVSPLGKKRMSYEYDNGNTKIPPLEVPPLKVSSLKEKNLHIADELNLALESARTESFADIEKHASKDPPYNRENLEAKIVHFGPSSFFSAHLATIVEDHNQTVADQGKQPDVGIAVVSMRSSGRVEILSKQDHLFTVGEIGSDSKESKLIRSVIDSVHSPSNPDKVSAFLEKAEIASLTVTQGGYHVDMNGGVCSLKSCHELVKDLNLLVERLQNGKNFSEIEDGEGYQTVLGPLVEEIAERYIDKRPPLVVMSLDNTPPKPNGEVLRAALFGLAEQVEKQSSSAELQGLASFIKNELPILSTVVDRITPGQNTLNKGWHEEQLGFGDQAAILAESHRSLKIQVDDPHGYIAKGIVSIPDFTNVDGVHQIPDVIPHMELKSRCLNSLDVVAGQIGARAGCKTVGEFVKVPEFASLEDAVLITELSRGVAGIENNKLQSYGEEVKGRRNNFEISGVNALSRLNNKGTDKIPNRIGIAISALCREEEAAKILTLTIACYLKNIIEKQDELGSKLALQDDDPLKVERIVTRFHRGGESAIKNTLLEESNTRTYLEGFTTFREGLSTLLEDLKDTPESDKVSKLICLYEKAGISNILKHEPWIFGGGTAPDGQENMVASSPSFQKMLINYYTDLNEKKVIDIAREIVNPVQQPPGYDARNL